MANRWFDTTKLAVDEINAAGGFAWPADRFDGIRPAVIHPTLHPVRDPSRKPEDKADVVHAGITSASREAIRPTLARVSDLVLLQRPV